MQAEKIRANCDAYSVPWGEEGTVEGETVKLTFTNQADGDKSTTHDVNDGKTTVFVDSGFAGTDTLLVEGSHGGEITVDVEFPG